MSAIDEVKQKTDIVEVISQYATLKKAGRNLTALCPFHSERNPSFYVYPEQQSWHCFGACNTGGDVFAFVMKKEGLDFGEALRFLAQRAGVTLPSRTEPGTRKEEKEEFYQVNEAAAVYFHNLLLNHPAAQKARDYVEKRGFTPKTVADFQLGFGLDSWEALKQYLKEKGYSEEIMLTCGLLSKSEDGRTYDRFRGKLMFPIRDIRGHVTGFGARVLDVSLPKYVNSPQTPTFDKSGTLYAIDRAAPEIRKQDRAIIMEGYMDVITAHQNGIANVVASMGTAVTETQVINILKKLTRNLILALDADIAGGKAMLVGASYEKLLAAENREIEEAWKQGIKYENLLDSEIRVVVMPEGKDPDDVIREDVKKWHNLVDKAIPIVDFTFNMFTFQLDLTTARDKSHAVDRLLPIVAAINDPIRQAHYLQKLAGLVKVDLNTIKASLSRLKPPPARRRAPVPPAIDRTARPLAAVPREEYLLALLLQYPELKKEIEDLSAEYFESSENREIFNICQECEGIDALKEKLDPAIHEHLDVILNRKLPETRSNIEQKLLDGILRLKEKYLKNMAARKAASGEVDTDPARLEEDVKISAQLRELDARRGRKRTGARR